MKTRIHMKTESKNARRASIASETSHDETEEEEEEAPGGESEQDKEIMREGAQRGGVSSARWHIERTLFHRLQAGAHLARAKRRRALGLVAKPILRRYRTYERTEFKYKHAFIT